MTTQASQIECGEMIRGNCTGDANPDAWYPTVPNGGKPETILRRMAPEIKYAIDLCNSCSKKDECLEEGMKSGNLAYGIWGGLLAGERIAVADEQGVDYLTPLNNTGRTIGPRIRARSAGKPNGGSIGGGSLYDDTHNKMTKAERTSAVLFAQRIKPYLEELNE